MAVVVDASICLAMAFHDERSELAMLLAEGLRTEDGLASPIWPLEVANALVSARKRSRLTEEEFEAAHAVLLGLPVQVGEIDGTESFGPVSALARAHDLSTYDASYLYLALRERVPLATLDSRLRVAAEAAGCELFV